MKRVRWIVGCAAVGLWIGFWNSATLGQMPLELPATEMVDAGSTMCRCQGDLGLRVQNIRRVLAEPLKATGMDFTEEPLENVVNFLQDEYNIPIQIDEAALESIGKTRDEPLTVRIQNISLKSALRLMLKAKQLTYVIQDEVLVVTTPDKAETELVACLYDVRGIIGHNRGNKNIVALKDAIVKCVAMETWAANGGGEAEIKSLQPGLLVISQTQAVHEEIHELLGLIRETLKNPVAESGRAAMGMVPTGGEGDFGMGRGGYGTEVDGGRGMEGGYGRGGYGGEMGGRGRGAVREREPTPAEHDPFGP